MPEVIKGMGPGRVKRQQICTFSDISVGQCMFRRCVFLFSEKYVLERVSKINAVSKYKKIPVRPHFDKL